MDRDLPPSSGSDHIGRYYAAARAEIPYPTQVRISRDADIVAPDLPRTRRRAGVGILAPLNDAQRGEPARRARLLEYADGEAIVRQGDPGSSMFVIAGGQATVTLDGAHVVARLGAGQFFGEMSLLTGSRNGPHLGGRGLPAARSP